MKKTTSNIWKDGKYIDLWSLIHFVSGGLLAGGLYGIGFNFLWAFVISLALILLWEVFEDLVDVSESRINIISDIIVGLLGFFAVAYWYYFLLHSFNFPVYIAVLVCDIVLVLSGFSIYLKEKKRL